LTVSLHHWVWMQAADATVKASLLFLAKFTVEDQAAWEDAWTAAHAKHDASFNAERGKVCAKLGPRIISGDDADAARILAELGAHLAALGIDRTMPVWQAGAAPDRSGSVSRYSVSVLITGLPAG